MYVYVVGLIVYEGVLSIMYVYVSGLIVYMTIFNINYVYGYLYVLVVIV